MALTDSAFCGAEFVRGVRRLGHHAVVRVRRDGLLSDGTKLNRMSHRGRRRGERVWLEGLEEIPM
jgi:hypothetical protein